jgi:hypothetical protein
MKSTAKSGSDGNATFSGDVVDISSSVSSLDLASFSFNNPLITYSNENDVYL